MAFQIRLQLSRGCAILEGKSLPAERERDVSAHCFSADLSTVTRDRENARVEIIFDVLSMDNRGGCTEGRISCDSSCLRGPLFFFLRIFHTTWTELFFIVVGKWKF